MYQLVINCTFPHRVGSYQEEVRKVLAEQLLAIFKLHPHLVIDFHRDILDFLGNLRNLMSGGEHCYMHLVRAHTDQHLN